MIHLNSQSFVWRHRVQGHQTWRPEPTETPVTELRRESVNSTLKELINIKESREARGRPIECQGWEGGREMK